MLLKFPCTWLENGHDEMISEIEMQNHTHFFCKCQTYNWIIPTYYNLIIR